MNLDSLLSDFNEKTKGRKSRGSYYTPNDVTNYINLNTIIMSLYDENISTLKDYKALNLLNNLNDNEKIISYLIKQFLILLVVVVNF